MIIESLRTKTIDVPFQLYDIFIIQDKYGLNKKTLQLYFYDLVLETALTFTIIPPVLYGYLYVVDYGGAYFFIYVKDLHERFLWAGPMSPLLPRKFFLLQLEFSIWVFLPAPSLSPPVSLDADHVFPSFRKLFYIFSLF